MLRGLYGNRRKGKAPPLQDAFVLLQDFIISKPLFAKMFTRKMCRMLQDIIDFTRCPIRSVVGDKEVFTFAELLQRAGASVGPN